MSNPLDPFDSLDPITNDFGPIEDELFHDLYPNAQTIASSAQGIISESNSTSNPINSHTYSIRPIIPATAESRTPPSSSDADEPIPQTGSDRSSSATPLTDSDRSSSTLPPNSDDDSFPRATGATVEETLLSIQNLTPYDLLSRSFMRCGQTPTLSNRLNLHLNFAYCAGSIRMDRLNYFLAQATQCASWYTSYKNYQTDFKSILELEESIITDINQNMAQIPISDVTSMCNALITRDLLSKTNRTLLSDIEFLALVILSTPPATSSSGPIAASSAPIPPSRKRPRS